MKDRRERKQEDLTEPHLLFYTVLISSLTLDSDTMKDRGEVKQEHLLKIGL